MGIIVINSNKYSALENIDNEIVANATPYPTISRITQNTVLEKAELAPLASKNIEVVSPHIGDNVKKDILVKGNARTDENIVGIRLWDSSGNVIAETTAETNSNSENQYGSFEKLLSFNTTDNSGELEIFEFNSNDGSISESVEIPLNFNQ